ncbi:Uncharacterised protein [Vibrio cholerae]|uniref:Uncharacterized protein n=1 Tax=Vibrio cholerae TaxID=666 RepID=A0A655RG57_VIBCL|nr:Uncharacterised protein [Vibrio cholerae]CSB77154.1 Uncharacterised protein [Vibrio cholerae]CSC28849.1 Uncharacterised protein [Vibrio cholerae]CSC73279.1 Uncharacterised protein [Vibrio cholerae]
MGERDQGLFVFAFWQNRKFSDGFIRFMQRLFNGVL